MPSKARYYKTFKLVLVAHSAGQADTVVFVKLWVLYNSSGGSLCVIYNALGLQELDDLYWNAAPAWQFTATKPRALRVSAILYNPLKLQKKYTQGKTFHPKFQPEYEG